MTTANRQTFIVGNWKMFKTSSEAVAFIHALIPLITHATDHIGLAVPTVSLEAAVAASKGTGLLIGAQNVCDGGGGGLYR